MRLRSSSEIAFRLKQEARNLALLARPPKLPQGAHPHTPFPDPQPIVEALRSTAIARQIVALADRIVLHRFPLLGLEIETGPEIRWRRDYGSGKETGCEYFRSIPYLNASVAGDHKAIWELNRHQHLVLLAQAYRLTGEKKYLDEIGLQLDSWYAANPMQRGINWASALEVAFRALSWMWVDHLVGIDLGTLRRTRLWEGLYRHAVHLEANLSVYFSPNTHLLGEAVALHALGVMFRGTGPAVKWERTGARIVAEEMQRQVRADGSHFEQSSYYHVYALDMFLFHAVLTVVSEQYRRSLKNMCVYLEALIGPSRSLAFVGDDDGGRFFHPYGHRDRFARATLAACGRFLAHSEWMGDENEIAEISGWWLGLPEGSRRSAMQPAPPQSPQRSTCFRDAGVAVMRAAPAHCIIDAGPFGPFRGGHSHADTLSIVARANGEELLIDPGTYSYDGDSPWRNRFRGTAAHNTVRIGGMDQAEPAGPFGWAAPPQTEILEWRTDEAADFLDAACRYRGLRHRRRVFFNKPGLLFILDEIEGGQIDAQQYWHPGAPTAAIAPGCFQIGHSGTLIVSGEAELSEGREFGWRSTAYGAKESAPLIVAKRSGEGLVRIGAVLSFSACASEASLAIDSLDDSVRMTMRGAWNIAATFPKAAMPHIQSL